MADNKGILIVYNTCTIRDDSWSESKLKTWKNDIEKILLQDLFKTTDSKLVVCECRGVEKDDWEKQESVKSWINDLQNSGVYHNLIKQYLPFGQAVNHSLKEIVNHEGTFDYYMYWSSGLTINHEYDENANNQLSNIYEYVKSNKNICRANLIASNDNGFPKNYSKESKNFCVVLPGSTVNDHCSIYSNEFFQSFNNCVRPDLFVGNGSEATFPYMAAALGKQTVILPESVSPILDHKKRSDGINNPGIATKPNKNWYIKKLADKVEDCEYLLDVGELTKKNINCEEVGILMMYGTSTGRIKHEDDFSKDVFGEDGMNLNKDDKNKLLNVMKSEFFLQNYDYTNIKSILTKPSF